MKKSHYTTPRTLDEACFLDPSAIYVAPMERRRRAAMDVLAAVGLGLAGAVFLVLWLSF